MRRRLRSNNTNILKLAMIGIVAMAGGFLLTSFLGSKSETQALSATEFQPGRIIDDSIFYNPNTMTAADIDAFIDSHNPACDMWGTQTVYGSTTRAEYVKQLRASGNSKYHDPPFVCITEYYENPETHKTNFETGGKKEEGMLSAGEIIYAAAHEYNINPQVLLVMLKKESYVWGDDWPHSFQYNTVMGYACPDGAPCDTKYFGFYNQVMMAAWQLNYYREHIYSYNYRPYATNNVLYNPDRSCGSKAVYLENIATTSLYIYTPYVPNDAALANYPGTSYCGSYGNRNFYMYFREWFGSTLAVTRSEAFFPDGEYYIVLNSDPTKSLQLENGKDGAGTKIALGNRTDSARNKFTIKKQSDGSYSFINSQSGQAMDITGASFTAGTSIEQWTSHGGDAQKFIINDNADGSYAIAPKRNKGFAIGYNSSDNMFYLDANIESDYQKVRLIPATQVIKDGTYRISPSNNLSYSLDINISNANVGLWSTNFGTNQLFDIKYDNTTGYYKLLANYNNNYALDVTGASKDLGVNIETWSANSSCAQSWSVYPLDDNSVYLLNACSGLALDISGGNYSNGTNITTWTPHRKANQRLSFIPTKISTFAPAAANTFYEINELSNNQTFLAEKNGVAALTGAQGETFLKFIALDNGNYIIQDKSSQKNLTANPSTKRISFKKNNTSCEQSWTIISKGDSVFDIIHTCTGLYLTSNNGISLSETPISGWGFSETTPSGGILSDGIYYITTALNPNYSLDIYGAESTYGTNIELWRAHRGTAQSFKLTYDESTEAYKISDTYTDRAMDVSGGNSRNGDNVIMWGSNSGCNQRWEIKQSDESPEQYYVLEKCHGLALDLYSTVAKNGPNVGVWGLHGGANQRWLFTKQQ